MCRYNCCALLVLISIYFSLSSGEILSQVWLTYFVLVPVRLSSFIFWLFLSTNRICCFTKISFHSQIYHRLMIHQAWNVVREVKETVFQDILIFTSLTSLMSFTQGLINYCSWAKSAPLFFFFLVLTCELRLVFTFKCLKKKKKAKRIIFYDSLKCFRIQIPVL